MSLDINVQYRRVGRVLKAIVLLGVVGVLPAESLAEDVKAWYGQPATEWKESLPLGNGCFLTGSISDEKK